MFHVKNQIFAVFISTTLLFITAGCSHNPEAQSKEVSIPKDFPHEYIEKSEIYLKSKYGDKIFNESIRLSRAYNDSFNSWGGCGDIVNNTYIDGNKYVVEYQLNTSRYAVGCRIWQILLTSQ